KAAAGRLLDVPERKWVAACLREPIIRRLVAAGRTTRADVDAAARELGVGRAQIYRLVKAYRANPITQSLVSANPGPKKQSRRLSSEVEMIIEEKIKSDYMRPERPSVQHLCREIQRACRAAKQDAPSRKAISARLKAHSPREMLKGR